MGLGGISVWQLILILLIAVFALVAVTLPHPADTPITRNDGTVEQAEDEASDEDPPLGVG
ncbi:MAG: hypothetical protein ACRD3Y_08955 [Bryobacteraceae bacterium]